MPLIIGFSGMRLFVKGDQYPARRDYDQNDIFETETMEGRPIRIFCNHVQFIEVVSQAAYEENKKRRDDNERKKLEIELPPGLARRIVKGTG